MYSILFWDNGSWWMQTTGTLPADRIFVESPHLIDALNALAHAWEYIDDISENRYLMKHKDV